MLLNADMTFWTCSGLTPCTPSRASPLERPALPIIPPLALDAAEVGGETFGQFILGVGEILFGRAVFSAVVFIPVLHKQAFYLIALLHEKKGRNGRVNAAGHTDNHFSINGCGG